LGNVTTGGDRTALVGNGSPADGNGQPPQELDDVPAQDGELGFSTPPDLDDDTPGADDPGSESESGDDE